MSTFAAPRKYRAFISYSSKDVKWGRWLHRKLENYVVPKPFRGFRAPDGEVLRERLRPVFRDRDELAGSARLATAIRAALQDSCCLVVLCSRQSARSEWVNREIEEFKALGGEERILALILDGIPNATGQASLDPSQECFPPALRHPMDPVAADLRKEADGQTRGFLKIVAGVSNLDFDSLYRRHERASRVRWFAVGTLAMGVIASLGLLSGVALHQAREANVSLSNQLLADGLATLQQGKVEEGLQTLVASLRAAPDNNYARDRLLFELSHRSWFFTSQSILLPSPLMVESADSTPDYRAETRITVNVRTDGAVEIETPMDSGVTRKSLWKGDGRWIVENVDEVEAPDPDSKNIEMGDGRRLFLSAQESKIGYGSVFVKDSRGYQPFKEKNYKTSAPSVVTPVGLGALSPDRKTVAIAGLAAPRPEEDASTAYENGHVYVSIFDAKTLLLSESFDFPIADDSDLVRIWWANGKLAIHTQQDNRELARLDWIDFTGERPRFLVKNKGVGHRAWYFQDGRLLVLRDVSKAPGTPSLRLEIEELKAASLMSKGAEQLAEDDVSVLADAAIAPPPPVLTWKSVATTYFSAFRIELAEVELPRLDRWSSGNKHRSVLTGQDRVTLESSDSGMTRVVPVRIGSGESGRQIDGAGFSPDGRYVVVKGYEVGGGSHDYEIIGSDVGLQVFPVVGPTNTLDIVPLFENALEYGGIQFRAIGWSRDGRYLLTAPGTPIAVGYRALVRDLTPGPVFLVPIRFCDGPVPAWVLEVVDEIIASPRKNSSVDSRALLLHRLRELARIHKGDEYGQWLRQFLGTP